jgi:phospholipid/cholesterol/gamma-HCH transport system substrate-binding protein
MERNAHYALVGLISMVLFIGLVVFVIWLGRMQFTKQYDIYDVDFKGPVRGLSSGGEVYFNGIKVGEVTKLSLDKANPNRVVARIRTASDAPVRVDSTASLEPQGITGVNYIQITAGTTSKPLLKDVTPEGHVPVVRSAQSQLESLLEGGGTVLSRAVDALDRVNKLLSDKNIATFSAALSDVQAVTAEVRDQKQLLGNLNDTIKSVNLTAQRFGAVADNANTLLNGDGRKALANLTQATDEIRTTAVDLRNSMQKLQGPASNFATTGLPQITRSIISLQEAAESLNRLVGEIEANPQALITKAPAKEVKVKP